MSLLTNLNPAQKQAVTHTDGPLVIVAGAGTGKTTVITKRIAWLMNEQDVSADNILALTFTEKAAEEMEERVEANLPYGYHDLWISTFHAFCERILQEEALEIGLPNSFKLLTETEQWLKLRQNLDDLGLDYYRPLGNPTKFLQALIKHFSRLKDENITPEEYLAYAESLQADTETLEKKVKAKDAAKDQIKDQDEAARIAELANAYHKYQQILLEDGSLDFGDLITYTIRLLKERPSILEKYQRQFEYVLVDEFQDTNHAQYELIKLLSAPQQNITVCLDDDQSIYKFRGASVSNVLEFKKDYSDSTDVVLTENYRSVQKILDLAYEFIQLNNPDRLEYQLQNSDELGSPISKKLKSQMSEKGNIETLSFETKEAEVKGILEKIIEIKKTNKEIQWSDFAILVRANDQAEQFMPIFDRNEIPYQFIASKGLYNKAEVIDSIAYLRMLDNYHETRSFYRVLNLEIFDIEPHEIMKLLDYSVQKSISLYEAATLSAVIPKIKEETIKNLEKILVLIAKHTDLARRKTAGEVLLAFLEDSGYLKNINSKEERVVIEKTSIIRQFYKQIEKFERGVDEKSVKNFLYEISLAQEAGERGDLSLDIELGPDSIKIMTMHASKGLEFPYVFIVNMVDKRFPTINRRDPILIPEDLIKETLPSGDAHIQEERRLFYVACTRAKNELYFTYAKDYGGTRKKKPSQFLHEAEVLTEEQEKDAKPQKKKPQDVLAEKVEIEESEKKRKSTEFIYQLPKKFSFTQITAFETCPYQYRFGHILKLPTKGKASFSFGKTLHNTLYHALKEMKEGRSGEVQKDLFGNTVQESETAQGATLERMLEIYEAEWIDDWYSSKKQKEEYKEKGKNILKDFYKKNIEKDPPKVQELEKPFNVRIGKYIVKGVIDRLDAGVEKDEVHIVDYKTGTTPKAEKLPEKKWMQLYIYALACEQVFDQKPKTLTYYYLDQNKPITKELDPKALRKAETKIEKSLDELHKSDFRATPGFSCQFCDYKDICDYKK